MKKSVFVKVEHPYSECSAKETIYSSSSVLVKSVLNESSIYTQGRCYDACAQVYLIQTCGCIDLEAPFLKNSTGVQHCITLTQVECLLSVLTSFYANTEKLENCKECPLECSSTEIGYGTSYTTYPNIAYANYLKNNSVILNNFDNDYSLITPSELRESILAVNIYFEKFDVFDEEHSKKTLPGDLISSMGGYALAFMGFSFLSLVEIVDVIFKAIFIIFKHKKS